MSLQRWPPKSTLENELALVCRRLDVTRVLDIGANIGAYGLLLRRLGYSGEIVSFEPGAEAFKRLSSTASKDPLWSARQVALGEVAGRFELNRFADSVFDSLRRPLAEAGFVGLRKIATETVSVELLDDMWSAVSAPGDRVFLKIDTQGFDMEVLRGGLSALDRSVGLQIELSGSPIYEDVPPAHSVLEFLHGHGYRLTGLFPIARNPKDGLQVVDFDAVLVNVNRLLRDAAAR
jgi:FkbM family methyltransferase